MEFLSNIFSRFVRSAYDLGFKDLEWSPQYIISFVQFISLISIFKLLDITCH